MTRRLLVALLLSSTAFPAAAAPPDEADFEAFYTATLALNAASNIGFTIQSLCDEIVPATTATNASAMAAWHERNDAAHKEVLAGMELLKTLMSGGKAAQRKDVDRNFAEDQDELKTSLRTELLAGSEPDRVRYCEGLVNWLQQRNYGTEADLIEALATLRRLQPVFAAEAKRLR